MLVALRLRAFSPAALASLTFIFFSCLAIGDALPVSLTSSPSCNSVVCTEAAYGRTHIGSAAPRGALKKDIARHDAFGLTETAGRQSASQGGLQLNQAAPASVLDEPFNALDTHAPYEKGSDPPTPSFVSLSAEAEALSEADVPARRRRLLPGAGSSLLYSIGQQQALSPSWIQRSVTSTNTPSAFTLSDPFAAWTAKPPPSPPPPPPPAEAPEAEAAQPVSQQPEGEAALPAATTPPTESASDKAGGEADDQSKQKPSEPPASTSDESTQSAAAAAAKESDAAAAEAQVAAQAEQAALEAAKPTEAAAKTEKEEQEQHPPSAESPSSTEASRAQRRSAAAHGGKTLEKALAVKLENVKLTEQETKEFVDTKEVAKNVRRLVGIKAGSNLHLENQKLIKPGCDIATFGPAYCASEDNPRAADILWSLENRKNNTYFVIALCMLAFAILVQCSCRVLERKVIRGGDQFSREVMETAFRQIAYIAIVDVILWGCMQSNVAEILDELIFGDVMPQHRDADIVLENVSPMLEVLFEELFFVAILLLIWYVVFVVLLQCLVRQLASWMRKVDEEEDVTTIARKAEVAEHSTCGTCIKADDIAKARFVAHRYEFGDNVQTMSIPGIDPSGYYFMEYMRASLMQMAIKMLRLPNSTLVLLMVVAVGVRPFLSVRVHPEAALLSVCSFLCLLGMLCTWAYVSCIERQLLPRKVPHYLVMRYHMEVGGEAGAEYIEEYTPPYKLQKQKSTWPGVCSRYFYGTTLPNKHQQLFCFWANGPNIVMRALEASYFCQLLVLAWWVQLLRSHPATWLRISWWGNIVVGLCALLHFGLLKQVLYTTLIALHSGMLVDNELLEQVWEIQRAENVRRTAELVDGLRVQSTLFAISEGGEMFWKQMKIKALSVSRPVREQMVAMWASLDEEHLGQIDRQKLFKFLRSQGLTIRTEADVNDFLQVFDRSNKGGVDEEEFYVLVIVVKQLLMEPLDKDALRALFEDKYGIPWSAPTGIDVNNLSRILSELGLQWSEGKRRYLLDFVGGKRGTTGVSADLFVSQLQAMEEQTLQPLQQVGGDVQKRPQERGGDRV
ncbi:hypothetical protein Efla_006339 [Eimeria flavescens]